MWLPRQNWLGETLDELSFSSGESESTKIVLPIDHNASSEERIEYECATSDRIDHFLTQHVGVKSGKKILLLTNS